MRSDELEAAEAMAIALLDTVGFQSVPGLNVFDLASRTGVTVQRRLLAVDGQLERHDGALRVSLSKRTGTERQRFTLAHEIGHVLLEDRSVAAIVARQVGGTLDVERFCNEFAAEILMPREWARSYREKPQNFETLNSFVDCCGVSNTAAVVRLSRHANWSAALLLFDCDRGWDITNLVGGPRWAKGAIEPLGETLRVIQAVDRDEDDGHARTIQIRARRRHVTARAEFQRADRGVLALARFEDRK